MDFELPKDHPLYGCELKIFSDEARLELYKYEDMVDAKFDVCLFEDLREAKLEKDEQNNSEQASEVKKPERKKPNSKEPTAKRAKVGKGKNVNESNAENEEAAEKWMSLIEEEKKAMDLYNAAATAENEDQEGYDKEDKEGQSDVKEAPAPGEVEELTDEE